MRPRSRSGQPAIAVGLLLTLAVWVVFGQTLRHEFVNYDDDEYVYDNSTVSRGPSLSGIAWVFAHADSGNWHPLTTVSHMVDCQFYGLNPAGHHLTNVLLHASTVTLLFLVLRNMTGAFWPSAFVAAVFGLHPLRVESVAWVAERKDVLSGLFFVLTLGAYVHAVRRVGGCRGKPEVRCLPAGHRPLTVKNYWLALLLFTLGLLSKPMVVTLPFVLLLLDYWPLGRWRRGSRAADEPLRPAADRQGQSPPLAWRLIHEKIPFLLLAAAAGVATMLAQKGAIQAVQNLSSVSRLANALVAFAVYLGQMLYPSGLAVHYPHPRDHLSVWTVGWSVAVLMIVTVGVMRWQRARPYLLVGWLWYLGMLVPVIGLLQVGSQAHADRYTYLPQIGLCIMAAWGVVDLRGAWRCNRFVLPAAAATILVALMILAHAQTASWRDSVSLWTHALASTSANSRAENNLGAALARQGRWDEAIRHYELAIRLKPDYAMAHGNIGAALSAQGKHDEAVHYFQRALQLKPDDADVQFDLGIALYRQGRTDEAVQHYERALQLQPDHAEAHYALGVILAAHGKFDDAIRHYERSIGIKPDNVKARNNLGSVLAAQGKFSEAIQCYELALRLNPDLAETHANLGVRLAEQGKSIEAVRHFHRALNLATAQANPTLAEAIRTRLASYQARSPGSNRP